STLVPGLYRWTTSVGMAEDITLAGGAKDTWILQITGDLTAESTKRVKLSGGALAKNIVWQVAGLVALDTGSHFEGVILCKTGITLKTGTTIDGRLFAQTAVIIDTSTVKQPAP
ncbi:MAG: ice-binding family protein, partial [Chitinophagaceae bacterium]